MNTNKLTDRRLKRARSGESETERKFTIHLILPGKSKKTTTKNNNF